jgi:acetolactate synthase regulatory subunit
MPTTSLTLEVQPDTDVLHRGICMCRRRMLQVVALRYAEQRITLTVTGSERQMRGIERWLSALLHVSTVQRHERASDPAWAIPFVRE